MPKPQFLLADPHVIQQVSASRTAFPKPVAVYRFLNIYGTNLLTAEGTLWARHRKITAPAFNEANMAFTWEQSLRILNDMFDSDWDRRERVVLDQTATTMKEVSMAFDRQTTANSFASQPDFSPNALSLYLY